MTVETIAAPGVVQERARWTNVATFPRCYFAAFLIDESHVLQVELTASGQVLSADIDGRYFKVINNAYCREINPAYIVSEDESYYFKLEDGRLQELSSDEFILDNGRFYLRKNMAWLDNLMAVANHEYSNKVRRTFYHQDDDSYSTNEPFRAIKAPPVSSVVPSPEKHSSREPDDETQAEETRVKPKAKIHRRPSFNSFADLIKASVLSVDESESTQVRLNLFQPAAEIDRPSIQDKLDHISEHYFFYANKKISLNALKDVVWKTVESPSLEELETAHRDACALFQSYTLDADRALTNQIIGRKTCLIFKVGVDGIFETYKSVYNLKKEAWREAPTQPSMGSDPITINGV